jgi:hypothetical protein
MLLAGGAKDGALGLAKRTSHYAVEAKSGSAGGGECFVFRAVVRSDGVAGVYWER